MPRILAQSATMILDFGGSMGINPTTGLPGIIYVLMQGKRVINNRFPPITPRG